jgi:NAD(P)H-hydrate epimerase
MALNPLRPLSRDEVRSIDATAAVELGLPTIVLMENAGRGAAERLRARLKPGDRVAIACGPGNNGGDGAVVARHLDSWGVPVRVAWFVEPEHLRGDAATQYDILRRSGIDQSSVTDPAADFDTLWRDAAWVVDALLGTGLTRPVEGLLAAAISSLNASGLPILSLDLPSGLDADSGVPLGIAVRASFTTTFVGPKLGFSAPGASGYTGAVEVVEIGVPGRVLEPFGRASSAPQGPGPQRPASPKGNAEIDDAKSMEPSQLYLEINYWTDYVGTFDPKKVIGLIRGVFPETVIDWTDYQDARLRQELEYFASIPEPPRETVIRQALSNAQDNGPTFQFQIPTGEGDVIKGRARRYSVRFEIPAGCPVEVRDQLRSFLEGLELGRATLRESS